MFEAEKKHMKNVDDEILYASKESLKKLQELDLATQMSGTSFYEVYLSGTRKAPEESIASNAKSFDRKKRS